MLHLNNVWSITILQYSPFTVFVWLSPLLICVTYTGFDLIGYYWLCSWYHDGCVPTVDEVYSSRTHIHTLEFSLVSVLYWVLHLFLVLLCLWTNDFRLTDDGAFLPCSFLNTVFLWGCQNNISFLIQALKPNVYDYIANMHKGKVMLAAHGGASFLGWHRIYLYL